MFGCLRASVRSIATASSALADAEAVGVEGVAEGDGEGVELRVGSADGVSSAGTSSTIGGGGSTSGAGGRGATGTTGCAGSGTGTGAGAIGSGVGSGVVGGGVVGSAGSTGGSVTTGGVVGRGSCGVVGSDDDDGDGDEVGGAGEVVAGVEGVTLPGLPGAWVPGASHPAAPTPGHTSAAAAGSAPRVRPHSMTAVAGTSGYRRLLTGLQDLDRLLTSGGHTTNPGLPQRTVARSDGMPERPGISAAAGGTGRRPGALRRWSRS